MGKLSLQMAAGPEDGRLLMQPIPVNSMLCLGSEKTVLYHAVFLNNSINFRHVIMNQCLILQSLLSSYYRMRCQNVS